MQPLNNSRFLKNDRKPIIYTLSLYENEKIVQCVYYCNIINSATRRRHTNPIHIILYYIVTLSSNILQTLSIYIYINKSVKFTFLET